MISDKVQHKLTRVSATYQGRIYTRFVYAMVDKKGHTHISAEDFMAVFRDAGVFIPNGATFLIG